MLLCDKSQPMKMYGLERDRKRLKKKEITPDLLTSEDPGSYILGTHWK